MTTRPRPTTQDMCDELCSPHTHREHYYTAHTNPDGTTTQIGADHVTTVPPLIDQLRDSVDRSTAADSGAGPAGFKSKPAARLDAIDAYIRIDLQAAKWVRDLGEDDPGSTTACIRRLSGLMPSAEDEARRAIETDMRRWWATARILTGWDSPAWSPDNTCPLCGNRGALRIRLADHIGHCCECQETWTEETIGLLADHIRAENAEGEDDEDAM